MAPSPPTGQSLFRSPLWATVAFHLAIASVDLLYGVCHQDRPLLPALQPLKLGAPLQSDVITMKRDRHTEDT